MKKPTPKVAVVRSNEAYWLSAGKNNRAITTVRKPKIMKSYPSSAFPITAEATWSGLGVERRDDGALMKSSRYSANPRRVPIINTNRDVTEDEYTKTSGSTHFRSSPLVRLASIPHAILEVAVSLRQ